MTDEDYMLYGADFFQFIQRAETLLRMAMFHYWLRGGDAADATEDDRDVRQVIDDMCASFVRLGFKEISTYENFVVELEARLKRETAEVQRLKDGI